ncbi:MASE1 domain-containing protein [Burkholderia cepacia]|uniref:MASE1 domain-containing protein n=1 Tax=Burkholderia cepacia TaxID=292 RepID=UPI00158ABA6D|nr:MASE1 domain-containing protein [Burkholderia cepacia]
MHIARWGRSWLRHLMVAVSYAIAYVVLRHFTISHWQLTAGFRVACLLLFPQRYWLALFMGDALSAGGTLYSCVVDRGLLWGVSFALAPMGLTMATVQFCKKYLPVIDAERRVVFRSLMLCIFACTLSTVAANILEYALMSGLPSGTRWSLAHLDSYCYLWFLGAGLGIYMIVPLALWAYTEGDPTWRNILTNVVRSRVLLSALCFLLPILYLLDYTIVYAHAEAIKHICQVAMLLAPSWFAWRYGWQGASVACMFANLAVMLPIPPLYDPHVLQTQTLMMVSSTLWLLVSARTSTFRLPETRT